MSASVTITGSQLSSGAAKHLDSGRRHDVSTSMMYYKDPGDGTPPMPVVVGSNTVKNERPSVAQDVIVRDITGEETKYNLDDNGFQFLHHESKETHFEDADKIKSKYHPEVEQLLKDVTGAPRVFVFDHRVRRGPSNWHKLGQNNRLNMGPLHKAHIDQSYRGAELELMNHLPDEADELLKRRYQIINVWRPIETILKDPLGVADASSVSDEDLVGAAIIKPTTRAETWAIKPNPAHRWYFKYRQRPDEVLLIKCFDSDKSVARRVPHSAFRDPAHDNDDNRQSIETRALVFYD